MTPKQTAEWLLKVKQAGLNPELHGHTKPTGRGNSVTAYRTGIRWNHLKALARAYLKQQEGSK